MKTSDVLKIFWNGEELFGQTFYVDVNPLKRTGPSFSLERWGQGAQVKMSRMCGDDWSVWLYDVRINAWPHSWLQQVEAALIELSSAANSVAWCAVEGCFADPPDLLDPSAMAEGVYAAFSKTTGFLCRTDLNSDFQTLTDIELRKLKAQLKGWQRNEPTSQP